jgi:hypothetical protein
MGDCGENLGDQSAERNVKVMLTRFKMEWRALLGVKLEATPITFW